MLELLQLEPGMLVRPYSAHEDGPLGPTRLLRRVDEDAHGEQWLVELLGSTTGGRQTEFWINAGSAIYRERQWQVFRLADRLAYPPDKE